MAHSKKRSVNPQQRYGSKQVTDIDSDTLNDIIKLIQDLEKVRLIQKLARPIEISTKQSLAQNFQQNLELLHTKLAKFRSNLIEKVAENQAKSQDQEYTSKTSQIKKKIRLIQSKYNQLFYQGSFKYYQKVKEIFNFTIEIDPMQIGDWSNDCIDRLAGKSTTCC